MQTRYALIVIQNALLNCRNSATLANTGGLQLAAYAPSSFCLMNIQEAICKGG